MKKECDWDVSQWDDPVYAKPSVNPPSIATRIQGKVLDATCLFFALDNRNMDMVGLLIRYNADMSALITFEGQEVIESKEDQNNSKHVIKNHHIVEITGTLRRMLGTMLGLRYQTEKKISGA